MACTKETINLKVKPASPNSSDRIRHKIPQTEPKSCLTPSPTARLKQHVAHLLFFFVFNFYLLGNS